MVRESELAAKDKDALLARVISLVFFLGIFVFVFNSYASHVTSSYFVIKKKVLAMSEKANRRELPEAVDPFLPHP